MVSTVAGFTHVDPFEDTERTWLAIRSARARTKVSPTSIRSRILKVQIVSVQPDRAQGFTHVDPFEDTERLVRRIPLTWQLKGFTHVDPFEDTESLPGCRN